MFLGFYSVKPRFDESHTKGSSLVAEIENINNTSHNRMILVCKANKKFIISFNLVETIKCGWALFCYLYFIAEKIQTESLNNMSNVTQLVSGELGYKVRSA